MDDRAVSPVVGKAFEIAVLVVFVGLVSSALFGSVVPDYRTAAGSEIGDRVLVATASQVEVAADVPPTVIERRAAVAMPRTIRGEPYAVRTETGNGTTRLRLDHPNPAIGGETALSLPPAVAAVDGAFDSTASPGVVVRARTNGTLEVTLQ